MLKHKSSTMIKISPLDMPDNDYFKFIDERMKELDIKDESLEKSFSKTRSNKRSDKNNLTHSTAKDVDIDSVNINTSHNNDVVEKPMVLKERSIQVDEVKPDTQEQCLSARSLSEYIKKLKPKASVEIAVNTVINFQNFHRQDE